jgi:hypothetical protein
MRQHGVRLFSERDLRLLRFVGEQTVVSLPQLAYLSGRSERTARWLRTRWERAGLVEAGKFASAQPTAVWATGAGLKQAGLPYHPARPDPGSAGRAMAAVEVRLAVEQEYPGARFVSQRELTHRCRRGERIADGLVEAGGAQVQLVIEQNPYLNDWQLEERLRAYRGRRTLLLAHPDLAARAVQTRASEITVVEWRWFPRWVRLPELPALQQLVPDTLSLREVAAAPLPERGAAATGPELDDEQWWLESEPVLDPGRPNWYQAR